MSKLNPAKNQSNTQQAMATLEVVDGPNPGDVYELDQDEVVIGRLPFCGIVLAQKNVSRQHTRILRSGAVYYVEDMHSTNGTYVNGRRITTRTPLRDMDRLAVYEVVFIFHDDTVNGDDELPEEEAPLEETADNKKRPTEPDLPVGSIVSQIRTNDRDKELTQADVRFRAVLEINRVLGATLDVDDVLPKILDALFTIFPQSDRGYILIPDEETAELAVRAEKYRNEGTLVASQIGLGPIPQKIANRVMLRGEAILNKDGIDEDEFEIQESVLDIPVRSMMCAPLIGPLERPVGIIYVDTKNEDEQFEPRDLDVMISVATSAGKSVEYAQAHEAKLQLDRRERDMAMARQVQLHFLPQNRPRVAGYSFFDYYRSAQEIGGDYYGYVPLPDGRLAVTVGDVSGKGVSAALIMARLCSDVRYNLATAVSPAEAVNLLNDEFAQPESDSWFVTFVLCILDPQTHELTIVNAGHMQPLFRRADGTVESPAIEEGGPPLGCDAGIKFEEIHTKLEPGDAMLLYTDGVNDSMDQDENLYGVKRIRKTIAKAPQELEAMCNFLLKDVKKFSNYQRQNDDICIVGVQRTA